MTSDEDNWPAGFHQLSRLLSDPFRTPAAACGFVNLIHSLSQTASFNLLEYLCASPRVAEVTKSTLQLEKSLENGDRLYPRCRRKRPRVSLCAVGPVCERTCTDNGDDGGYVAARCAQREASRENNLSLEKKGGGGPGLAQVRSKLPDKTEGGPDGSRIACR